MIYPAWIYQATISPEGHCPFDLQVQRLFYAPLQRDLSFQGIGAPTFVRATTATYIDQDDGKIKIAASGVPRFEKNGYLSEGQRTNLCLRSEEFNVDGSGSPWLHTRVTVTANAIVAPDGNFMADSINEDGTSSSSHVVLQDITITDGADLALSVFLKESNRNWVRLKCTSAAGGFEAFFNLATGAVGLTGTTGAGGTFTSAYVETELFPGAWNGFLRVVLVGKLPAGDTAAIVLVYAAEADNDISFNGLSQSSFYAWGAMLEE